MLLVLQIFIISIIATLMLGLILWLFNKIIEEEK